MVEKWSNSITHVVWTGQRALTRASAERQRFVFFFQLLYPFRWVCDRRHKMAAAAGGTMLVSRPALDRIDGVHSIRDRLIDDVALARAVKSGGHGIWLGHAERATSLRVYETPRDVWDMVARTAYVQLERSPLILLGTVLAMIVTYLVPVLALLAGGRPPSSAWRRG